MENKVIDRVRRLFRFQAELVELLPESALAEKLNMPSNTIGAQYWCVVGARESYTKAIREDDWAGFGCSLTGTDTTDKQKVLTALVASAAAFDQAIEGLEWTEARRDLLLDLMEHETQHQGQLIRYVYGLHLKFPQSWLDRWSLEQTK
ncbi:MAG: hypothetical protein WD751_01385 [Anaerolineales bacterium]